MSTHTSIPLQFRAATEADVIAVTGLLTQLNRAEGNPKVMDAALLHEGLFGTNRIVPLRALLAVCGDHIAGAALYYTGYDILTSVIGYHLGDLVVDETMRRRGVGRALMAALAKQNFAEGGEWISLTALVSNPRAVAFYSALGMVDVPVKFFAAGKYILNDLIAAGTK